MPKFRSFLPTVTAYNAAIRDDEVEADGTCWQLRWGPMVIEFTIAKAIRRGDAAR